MSTLRTPKPNRRSFNPSTLSLEERVTPSVGALVVFGLSPSPASAGKITIAGVVGDSNHAALAGMSVDYSVADHDGNVLASGPMKLLKFLPNSTLAGFTAKVAIPGSPGDVETITLIAREPVPFGDVMTAATNLTLASTKGVSTLGVGATENDGDVYSGEGHGRISITPLADGGFVAKGSGAIKLASASDNEGTLMNARGTGDFTFGLGPNGNIGLTVDKGRGELNVGTYAGDSTASGGMTLKAAGHLDIVRRADRSISADADGSLSLAAKWGASTSSDGTPPSTIQGTARRVRLALKTDGRGLYKLGLSGKLNMTGSLENAVLPILG